MLASSTPPLATATPLGVATVPDTLTRRPGRAVPWRLAGRVLAAVAGIMAVGTAISVAVAGAFLLIAVATR